MHPRATPHLFAIACLMTGVAACGDGDQARTGTCGAGVLPGDLVITEILANPSGTDSGKEWFEIYNATDAPIDLTGLLLRSATAEGGSIKEHAFAELSIEPGQYLVVGNVIEEVRPEYVDYGYGNDLGDLRNTAGTLAVSCGDSPIDVVLYDGAKDGTSRGFDGGRPPDATANDDLTSWCDATSQFDDELAGTPGAANDACAGVGVPTTCTENGELRDVVAPQIGDLVISEFHADPDIVGDSEGEWFEIYAHTRVDLNGVSFARVEGEPDGGIAGAECITVEAGAYFVVAREIDAAVNGGLPVVDAEFIFALGNSAGALILGYGEDILDQITWSGSSPGAASALDPAYLSAEANDNPMAFCAAQTPYGDGDRGTPGAANDVTCDVAPPDGQCFNGTAFVDVIPPSTGDLVITEFIANPSAVDDPAGEWIEIRANAAVHLNGLELGRDGEVQSTITASDCILVGVDDHVAIAREDDPATNGGIPEVAATFSFSLVNSDGNLFIGHSGTVLDEITWATSVAGASTALDPSITDPVGNDDPAAWCTSTSAYGDGDLGTPGAENPACGTVSPGTCSDGGDERPTVAPALGDLVITEFMPDPSAVTDANGEWFEVLVTADVDLNGVEFGREVGNVDVTLDVGGDCLAVSAGSRVVLARSADPLVNGGLDPVLATFGFGLANAGGSLFVGYGGEALDVITYSGSSPGTATTLDPAAENPMDNDDQGNFCAATAVYGAGDRGSPGAVGNDCGGGQQDGMCDDGVSMRAIVAPGPGEVVITELMANPAAVGDAAGEWFEVAALADFDLNGVQVFRLDDGVTPTAVQTLGSPACLEVESGDRVLFVRNPDPVANGGLPEGGFVFGFSLVNSNGGMGIGVDDAVLDAIAWATVPTGASRSLDEGSVDTGANDDATNWCAATTVYGAGDSGTPAATNDACP